MKIVAPLKVLLAAGSLSAASTANALYSYITYDTWTTNENGTGNYIITVTHYTDDNQFDVHFTVEPWNAEGLGLFF